jgi:hypothetical protein
MGLMGLLSNQTVLLRLKDAITRHPDHIQDDAVMDHPVNSGHRGHGVLEDLVPSGKHEIGRNEHGPLFIPFRKEGKKHFHFFAILLNIANVIEHEASNLLKPSNLLGETQGAFGRQQALDKGRGAGPEHRMPLLDEFVAKSCGQMGFSPSIRMPS